MCNQLFVILAPVGCSHDARKSGSLILLTIMSSWRRAWRTGETSKTKSKSSSSQRGTYTLSPNGAPANCTFARADPHVDLSGDLYGLISINTQLDAKAILCKYDTDLTAFFRCADRSKVKFESHKWTINKPSVHIFELTTFEAIFKVGGCEPNGCKWCCWGRFWHYARRYEDPNDQFDHIIPQASPIPSTVEVNHSNPSIHVANLEKSITHAQLVSYLGRAGKLISLDLNSPRKVGAAHPSATALFANGHEAQTAIQMFNGNMLKGRPLRVKLNRGAHNASPQPKAHTEKVKKRDRPVIVDGSRNSSLSSETARLHL